MGSLVYGANTEYGFDDRVLAHLKIAIIAKLRVNDAFLLNWTVPASEGSGRVSLWMSAGIPLQFHFKGSKAPELNRTWLEAMERSSHSMRGMVVMSESEAEDYIKAAGRATAP